MTRYDFILLSGETEQFLQKLQELGVVDITRAVKAIDEKSASMISEAESLKARIGWLKNGLFEKDEKYAGILASVKEWEAEEKLRECWGEFDKEALDRLDGLKLRFYSVRRKVFDPQWETLVPLQIISEDADKVNFVTVSGKEEEYSFPVAECDAPADSAAQAHEKVKEFRRQLSEREAELRKEQEGVESLEKKYSAKLEELDFYYANAATEKAAEDTLTVISGFAPSENDAVLTGEFDKMDVFYTAHKADVSDNPPIQLRNNRFVKMFEVLTDMYGRPAYDGFDSTVFISIFFLLFFAMCMGDMGYGMVLVLVGLLLRKNDGFRKLSPLVVTLGVGTMVVGLYFHTFFSCDMTGWSIIPDWMKKCMLPSKVGTFDAAMIMSLIVGVVHLCLAMIVKTYEATKVKGFTNSLGTWGWTLLIVGGVIVGGCALAGVIDSNVTRTIIIVLGIVSAIGIYLLNDLHRNPLLNIGSGLWETYNTATGLLGDVLSYLRLYALGLAGSMLGFAFNNLAGMTLGDGGAGWIPFILIVLVGHTLNIAMAVLGAFVHPLRLNFLEFFKNSGYEGAGRNYNPLKKNN